jgi:hypothetical protein
MPTPRTFMQMWIFAMAFIAMIYFLISGFQRDAANYQPRSSTHITLP